MNDKQEEIIARLSVASLCIDILVVVFFYFIFLTKIKYSPYIYLYGISESLISILSFPLFLLAYFFIVDVILNGSSLGRICTGLSISRNGDWIGAGPAKRLGRFAGILKTLGLSALSIQSVPKYNLTRNIHLASDLTPTPIRQDNAVPSRGANFGTLSDQKTSGSPVSKSANYSYQLAVLTGGAAGKRAHIKSGRKFAETGEFRIGRDPAWADLVLTSDSSVSGQHCRIIVKEGIVYVVDWGKNGEGSANGTFVGENRAAPKKAIVIKPGGILRLGDVRISID